MKFLFESFKNDLLENIVPCNRMLNVLNLTKKFASVLHSLASKKKKWFRGDQKAHVNEI